MTFTPKAEKVNIGSVSDANYGPYLGVMIYSLLKNTKNPTNKHFYIIDAGIKPADKVHIQEIVKKRGASLEFLKIDEKKYAHLSVHSHWTRATYYRLSFPDLLPDLPRLLYLDCDILCLGDIDDVYNKQLGSQPIGAVRDMGPVDLTHLGVEDPKLCFNGGVLLFNLPQWRDDNISDALEKYIAQDHEKILVVDQDVLNAVLHKRWIDIGISANVQLHPFTFFNRGKAREMLGNAVILHYSSEYKPLGSLCIAFRGIFNEYLRETPWKNYVRPKPTLRVFIKYIYFTYFPMSMRVVIRKFVLNPLGFRKNMLGA